LTANFRWKQDVASKPMLVPENYSDYFFIRYQNIDSIFFLFVTKHACVIRTESDGQTDGQTDRITITKTALA